MKKLFAMTAALLLILTGTAFAQAPTFEDVEPLMEGDPTEMEIEPLEEEVEAGLVDDQYGVCPRAIGWAGGGYASYCNHDRGFLFFNWVEVAQWMNVMAWDIDRMLLVRKPGIYVFCEPMKVRLASNGDVRVSFAEIWGDGNFNAKYLGGTATPLKPQIPVLKLYRIILTDASMVDEAPSEGWQNTPAGDTGNDMVFLNSEAMHSYCTPTCGFDMYVKEIVRPCNTTSCYGMVGLVDFFLVNQKPWIDRRTGCFNL